MDASESWKMSTVPQPGADLAFYLVDSEPLPKDVIPEFDSTRWSSTKIAASEQIGWVDADDVVELTEKDAVVESVLDLPPTVVTVRAS